ncbi:hypothetical protein PINS_up014040 [Pythium insidiosum]|nr:hypothetical protein PINS_up014040 [Pythium insidiosum]
MARAGSKSEKKAKKQHGSTASLKDTASAKRLSKAATVSSAATALRLDAARRPLKPTYLHGDLIYAIPSFMSKNECERVIKFAQAQGFERVTQRATKLYAFRDNDRILLRMPEFAEMLWQRMKPLVPAEYEGMYAAGLNPAIRFYRYNKGQRFGCHVDQSDVDAETGFHSRFTVLVYLNDASDSALDGRRDHLLRQRSRCEGAGRRAERQPRDGLCAGAWPRRPLSAARGRAREGRRQVSASALTSCTRPLRHGERTAGAQLINATTRSLGTIRTANPRYSDIRTVNQNDEMSLF